MTGEYIFDVTNQMVRADIHRNGMLQRADYSYNGLGHRLRQDIRKLKKVSSQEALDMPLLPSDQQKSIYYTLDMTRQYHNLLELSDTTNKISQNFSWDGNVVGMDKSGEFCYYIQDDHGSQMQLTDADGVSHASYAYDTM